MLIYRFCRMGTSRDSTSSLCWSLSFWYIPFCVSCTQSDLSLHNPTVHLCVPFACVQATYMLKSRLSFQSLCMLSLFFLHSFLTPPAFLFSNTVIFLNKNKMFLFLIHDFMLFDKTVTVTLKVYQRLGDFFFWRAVSPTGGHCSNNPYYSFEVIV